jgi:hypothetical protein
VQSRVRRVNNFASQFRPRPFAKRRALTGFTPEPASLFIMPLCCFFCRWRSGRPRSQSLNQGRRQDHQSRPEKCSYHPARGEYDKPFCLRRVRFSSVMVAPFRMGVKEAADRFLSGQSTTKTNRFDRQ